MQSEEARLRHQACLGLQVGKLDPWPSSDGACSMLAKRHVSCKADYS